MSGGLGVGIVGASIDGGWAMRAHVPALQAVPGYRLVAVATTREESARKTAEALGLASGYTDPASLACDPAVDLVVVCVRVPAHDSVVSAAIAAGKQVLCEWPLAGNTAEAVALRDGADEAGTPTMIGLQGRQQPAVLALRDLVRSGELGEVLAVQAFSGGRALGTPSLTPDRAWTADARSGVSAFTVRFAHTLDAIEFAISPLDEVGADVRVKTPDVLLPDGSHVRRTAHDQVAVVGRLDNGAALSALVVAGANPPVTQPLVTVLGTKASATIISSGLDPMIQYSALSLVLSSADGQHHVVSLDEGTLGALGSPAASVARVYAAMTEDPATVPGFDRAVELHRTLDGILDRQLLGPAER